MPPPPLALRETAREQQFSLVWSRELEKVFADVAPYYDRANDVATLGLCGWLRRSFIRTIDVQAGMRVLDVCAGTNAVGMRLLEREPALEVHAMDRSAAMQEVGRSRAQARGMHIRSYIGDVHRLPFPDNHFDVVTLQFASRHLGVKRVFSEIHRVLKPGGRFHHCDMLRPANPLVEQAYYAYLRACLATTAFVFGCGNAALGCKKYFIEALQMFYSPAELAIVMKDSGFGQVDYRPVMLGVMAFHTAVKA